jgi:Tol biopolymer transport system component
MKDVALELREVVDEWDNIAPTATSVGIATSGKLAAIRTRPSFLVVAAAALVALGAVAVAVWALTRGGAVDPSQPFQTMKMATQTNRADLTDVAISRDGRYFAYLTGELGEASVRVRQIATGSDLEVVPSEEGIFEGLSFSPDGNYLFYLKRKRDAPNYRALMQVPSLGGASRERAFDVDTKVSFSPDGKQIVFVRGEPQHKRALVVVRDLDAGQERTLATLGEPVRHSAAPVWSPDGTKIATAELSASSGVFLGSIVIFDAASGRREVLESATGCIPESLAWLPDGRGVLRSGYDFSTAVTRQIALVDYPKGRTRRITNDVTDYRQVSVSSGDEALAAVRTSVLTDLWIADASGGSPRPLTSFRNAEHSPFGLSICPDGSAVFAGSRNQSVQLWAVDPSGGTPRSVTDGATLAIRPFCHAGGLVYDQYADGGVHVWQVDLESGSRRNLTPDAPAQAGDVARDGSLVTVGHLDDNSLWSITTSDGKSYSLGTHSGTGKISPDATKVIVSDITTGATGLIERRVKVVPATGGEPLANPAIPPRGESLGWLPDGSAVTFVDRSATVWNLFAAPLSGAPPRQITGFIAGRIAKYEFSPDGRKLAVALTIDDATNVWLTGADGSSPVQITNFHKDDVFDLRWMPDNARLVVNVGKASADAVLIRDFR